MNRYRPAVVGDTLEAMITPILADLDRLLGELPAALVDEYPEPLERSRAAEEVRQRLLEAIGSAAAVRAEAVKELDDRDGREATAAALGITPFAVYKLVKRLAKAKAGAAA